MTGRPLTQADIARIGELRERGATQREAAAALGRSERSVRAHWWATLDAELTADDAAVRTDDGQLALPATGSALADPAVSERVPAVVGAVGGALAVLDSVTREGARGDVELDWRRVALIGGALVLGALAAWVWYRHRRAAHLEVVPAVPSAASDAALGSLHVVRDIDDDGHALADGAPS